MAEDKKNIAYANIGNALRSAAKDHTVTFADEVFDTERQKYQDEVTSDIETKIEDETARATAAEEANATSIIGTERIADGAVTTEKLADSAIDDEPTTGSDNLVKSGGVANKLAELEDGVNDLAFKTFKHSFSSESAAYCFSPFNFVKGETYYLRRTDNTAGMTSTIRILTEPIADDTHTVQNLTGNVNKGIEFEANDNAKYIGIYCNAAGIVFEISLKKALEHQIDRLNEVSFDSYDMGDASKKKVYFTGGVSPIISFYKFSNFGKVVVEMPENRTMMLFGVSNNVEIFVNKESYEIVNYKALIVRDNTLYVVDFPNIKNGDVVLLANGTASISGLLTDYVYASGLSKCVTKDYFDEQILSTHTSINALSNLIPLKYKVSLKNGTKNNPANIDCVHDDDGVPVCEGNVAFIKTGRNPANGNHYVYFVQTRDSENNIVRNIVHGSPDLYSTVIEKNESKIFFSIEERKQDDTVVTLREQDFSDVDSFVMVKQKATLFAEEVSKEVFPVNVQFASSGESYVFAKCDIIKGRKYRLTRVEGVGYTTTIRTTTEELISDDVTIDKFTDKNNFTSFEFIASGDANYIGIYCSAAGIKFHIEDIDALANRLLRVEEKVNKVEEKVNVDIYDELNPIIDQIKFRSDVSLLFFSDVHRSAKNVERIVNFANNFHPSAIINGGDNVLYYTNSDGDETQWYDDLVSKSNVPVLTAVGNHDAWTSNEADGNGVRWGNENVWWCKPEIPYTRIISKVVMDNSIVTEPNALYYYKDFGDVRIIVLCCDQLSGYWDDAQKTWMSSSLTNAVTNNKSVIIVNHCPCSGNNVAPFNTGFCTWMGFRHDIIDDKQTVQNDSLAIMDDALSEVDTFISNGGKFICWLCGHTHYDYVLKRTDHSNQVIFVTGSASHEKGSDYNHTSDEDNLNYDTFNLLSVDTTRGLLKILRIGNNVDGEFNRKNVIVIDYNNGNLVRSW